MSPLRRGLCSPVRQGGWQIAGRWRSSHSRLARYAVVAATTIASLLAVGVHAATAAGAPHTLGVSTDELNFGQRTLGVDGGSLTFTLSNNGTSTDSIDLDSGTFTGPGDADYFLLSSPGCPGGGGPRIVLASGQSCLIDVSFFPTALGPLPATVTIQGSADTSGVSVNLMATHSSGARRDPCA
jgi:hypothetical protein